MRRSASRLRKRTETCRPVPSPQQNCAPLAVGKCMVPRRRNFPRKKRRHPSIEITRQRLPCATLSVQFISRLRRPNHNNAETPALLGARKADIREWLGGGIASSARFHSRHNRLKGDRRGLAVKVPNLALAAAN